MRTLSSPATLSYLTQASRLKGVENRTHVGLDGRPLKDRLEELAEKTAKDIKDCANFCDTFVKKKLLVKVFKGPVGPRS